MLWLWFLHGLHNVLLIIQERRQAWKIKIYFGVGLAVSCYKHSSATHWWELMSSSEKANLLLYSILEQSIPSWKKSFRSGMNRSGVVPEIGYETYSQNSGSLYVSRIWRISAPKSATKTTTFERRAMWALNRCMTFTWCSPDIYLTT